MFRKLQLCNERSRSIQKTESSHPLISKSLSPIWIISAIVIVIMVIGPAFIQSSNAQPLDTAIADLLDNVGGDLCGKLTGAGAILDPSGTLGAFCAQGGGGDPASAGGGAGTPNTAPGIVQERLQEQRGDYSEGSETAVTSELMPGWSVFFSADGEQLDRDVTTFEDGYDSDIWGATVGTDYQLTAKSIVGLAFTFANQDGDFTGGGDFENDSYGFIAFASFIPTEKTFVQATIGYAWKDYDRTRIVSGTVTEPGLGLELGGSVNGSFDGNEFSTGVLAGYDHTIGNLTIGPRIGLDWIYTEFDSFTEQGDTGLELVFDDSDETSVQSRLGFVASMAVSTGFGVLVPQFSADWVHEFGDDQRTLAFSFAEDLAGVNFTYEDEEPDENFFELAVGISAILPNGWLPYAQFRTIVGHDFLDSYAGTIGLRMEF